MRLSTGGFAATASARTKRDRRSERVILFDLGGVLVEACGLEALRTMLPGERGSNVIMARWLASPAAGRFERGMTTPAEFASEFLAEWNLELDPAVFIEAFAVWVTGFVDGAKALVRELRTRYHVACLSNVNAMHWAHLLDPGQMFDAVFASPLAGLLRHVPAVFEHALRALGVPAKVACYFDDQALYVNAARALSLSAHRVVSVIEIENVLRVEDLWA